MINIVGELFVVGFLVLVFILIGGDLGVISSD